MNLRTKQPFVKVLFVIALLLSSTLSVHSYVVLNRGNNAFEEEEADSFARVANTSMSIKSYIIQGAGYFLAGNSDFLAALNRVELAENPQSLDYIELQTQVNKAVDNMSHAYMMYEGLEAKANATPYNQSMIDALVNFDYKVFKKNRAMSGDFVINLEGYLSTGDVRGVFAALKAKNRIILNALLVLKNTVDNNTFPAISDLWRLNQFFSETLLFGQYAAEVFYEVSK